MDAGGARSGKISFWVTYIPTEPADCNILLKHKDIVTKEFDTYSAWETMETLKYWILSMFQCELIAAGYWSVDSPEQWAICVPDYSKDKLIRDTGSFWKQFRGHGKGSADGYGLEVYVDRYSYRCRFVVRCSMNVFRAVEQMHSK
jgi:hypothetical protein